MPVAEGLERFIPGRDDTVLLIIDFQERLAQVMPTRDQAVRNILHLVEIAKLYGLPILVTEQYPKGLGRTVPEIQAALPSYRPLEKMAFGCCDEPGFLPEAAALGRRTFLLAGMEAHVCVLQACLGLLKNGFVPHVVKDALCSRHKQDWETGIEMMRDAGAVITCTETALFQLLGVAGTEEFKKIFQRLK